MAKTVRDEPYSRVVAHFIAEFMLRGAESIGALFGHDYEIAIIFLAISTRNTQTVMNDPALREKFGSYSVRVPAEHSTPISRLALARSTGLPRETVRRKVARLLEWKLIVEDRRGGLRVPSGLNEGAAYVSVLKPQMPNLRRLFGVLLDAGLMDEVLAQKGYDVKSKTPRRKGGASQRR